MNARLQTNLPKLEALGLTCLAHLEQEEAMLSATLQTLRDMRTALMHRDLQRLTEALERQQHTAKAAAELRTVRATLRARIAEMIRVPADHVTLGLLAAQLTDAMQQRMLGYQKRLSDMAAEVALLNRGNAVLIRHSVGLLQRLLMCLTGGDESTDRYARSGQREEGDCGSIFETQC